MRPGIQVNRLGLKEHEFRVFTIHSNLSPYSEFISLSVLEPGLEYVHILETSDNFHYTLPELLELAKGKYPNGQQQEGIVIRPKNRTYSKYLNGNLSFKVLNNDWLEREK